MSENCPVYTVPLKTGFLISPLVLLKFSAIYSLAKSVYIVHTFFIRDKNEKKKKKKRKKRKKKVIKSTWLILRCIIDYMGRAMRKRVFGHMWIAKVQISLRIRAVWS